MGLDHERLTGGQVTLGQHLDQPALAPLHQPFRGQRLHGQLPAAREHPRQIPEVHDLEFAPGRVVEAALRDPAVKRHLPALEAAPLPAARASLVPLVATGRGLPVPRAGAAADSLGLLPRAGGRPEVTQVHADFSSSTRTAYGTRATIPRIDGVSSCSTVARIFRSPRARSVFT